MTHEKHYICFDMYCMCTLCQNKCNALRLFVVVYKLVMLMLCCY